MLPVLLLSLAVVNGPAGFEPIRKPGLSLGWKVAPEQGRK